MSTLELEAQKAQLAREILNATDEEGVMELMRYFRIAQEAVPNRQQERKIGLLDGKVSFTDDGDREPYSAADFLKDWTGLLKGMTDEEANDAKYEYLMQKQQ